MTTVLPDPKSQRRSPGKSLLLLRIVVWLLLVVAVARTAWIGDGALITLRHGLNLTHGWGAGFKATESVLGATHPLWLLVWAGLGSIFDYWIVTNFVVSIVFSAAALALLLWSARTALLAVSAGALLFLSSAFIDYTTSGLENPLALFLTGLFILQSRRNEFDRPTDALFFGLTLAALLLTRFDLALMVLPVSLFLVWTNRQRIRSVSVGLVAFVFPVASWLTWSWFTYKALVPNTLAAKANVEIARQDLVVQGLRYLGISFEFDWMTALILVLGACLIVILGASWHRLWLFGVVFYLSYVVWVGGDFMVGRFLSLPVYVVVFVVVLLPGSEEWFKDRQRRAVLSLTAAFVGLSMILVIAGPTPTALTRDPGQRWSGSFGIADERGVYAELGRTLHVLAAELRNPQTFEYVEVSSANPWGRISDYELAAQQWPDNEGTLLSQPDEVGVVCWLGATALVTGPRVHWIDTCALTDRFLAEIPSSGDNWRIGHFKRDVPDGYAQAILTSDPGKVTDPELQTQLRDLWERIR